MRVAANGLGGGTEVCEKCISDGWRIVRSCVKEGLLEGHDDDVKSRLVANACGS